MNVMGLTRRNTIIGLGALAGGAGVIGATGAFTSVEADRQVTVEAAGDGAALLAIEPNEDYNGETEDYVDTPDDDTLAIDIVADSGNDDYGVNLNATTVFNELITITNNGSQEIGLSIDDYTDDNSNAVTDEDSPQPIIDFKDSEDNSLLTNTLTISDGDSENITVEVNTQGFTTVEAFNSEFNDVADDNDLTITINADQADA